MSTRRTERNGAAARAAAVVGPLLLLVGGCASLWQERAATLATQPDIPAAWTDTTTVPAGGPTPLARWWEQFDDPLLGTLVAEALKANTSIRGAESALAQARALRDVAAAALWPTVIASASAQRATGGVHTTANDFQASASGTWGPDVFGASRSALHAAEATAQSSSASLGDVQVQVAAEVGLDYIALRSSQVRLAIAAENLKIEEETQQIAQWREQAGLGSSLESEQARAQTEQTRALLPVLTTSIAQSSHALAVLTGRPPAALLERLTSAAPVPSAADRLAVSIPAEALRQRADVRAAERGMAAALARLDQAKAARAPNFTLGGSVGLSALTLGALTSGGSVVSAVLASVSVPVFDGGAARAEVRAQQAALEQSRAAYRSAVLTALQDVEDALVALRGDRERLVSLRNAAEAAANASLLARERYRSGLVDFQTVLDTQRSQLGTQDSVASANADVSSDHVRLFKALGGGWVPEDLRAAGRPTESVARASPP